MTNDHFAWYISFVLQLKHPTRILHLELLYLYQEEAKEHLVGGVPGGARYRKPYPIYAKDARGSRIWDVDGNEYIDILCGGGPAILGHSPAPVIEAVKRQLDHGTNIMVSGEPSVELAKKIKSPRY